MATPEKLYFSTALEIGAGGLLCSTASQQNVSVIIAKQVSHITFAPDFLPELTLQSFITRSG